MDFYLHTHPRLREKHAIDRDVLDEAILEFEGVALKFARDFILDAKQRANYERNTQRVKAEVIRQLDLSKVTAKSAAEFCYTLRDYLLKETRALTSVQGRAVVEWRKKESPALEALLEKNAMSRFGMRFADLDLSQRDVVHYMIVESSARPSIFFNILNKTLAVVGKVLIVVTIAYAAYEIMNADNKLKEAITQGATIGSGFLGAAAGASLASVLCGPGAPICAIGFIVATGLSSVLLASEFIEYIDDELDEFARYWSY